MEPEPEGSEEPEEDDNNFDFGRAKMDYFKKRAKEILMDENQFEYDGAPVPLPNAYKNLKNILRNPIVVHA